MQSSSLDLSVTAAPSNHVDLSNAIGDSSDSESDSDSDSDSDNDNDNDNDNDREEESHKKEAGMSSSMATAHPLTTAITSAGNHGSIEDKQLPTPVQSDLSFDHYDQKKLFERIQKKLERKFCKLDKHRAAKEKMMKSVCTSNPAPVELAARVRPEHLLKEFRNALKHSIPLYPTYLHGTIQKATE